MLPFTVERESCRPPLPMVPCRCRGPNLPVTRRGKSVTRSPFTVEARTSVERSERSEEHTSELQSRVDLVCRLLLEKKKKKKKKLKEIEVINIKVNEEVAL